jgi:hypothetical protein
MTIKIDIKITTILILPLFIVGCERVNEIAVVKNNSKKPIFIIYTLGKVATDSSIGRYFNTLKEYTIDPNSVKKLSTFDRALDKEPDSSTIYLRIFNLDSLNKYGKVSHFKGILTHSLVKSINIQLNKVKEPVDTIYVDKN